MQTPLQEALVLAVVLLNGYCFGANCVERFVNYQSWPTLARADFGTYHRAQQPWILGFVVAPIFIALVLQVLLLPVRPPTLPGWILPTLIGTSIAGFLSTLALQIPIHRRLDHGYSTELVNKLLRTDWIRKAADVLRLAATIALLQHSLR